MITENQKKDYNKFFDHKADASFVARHNKDVVDEVIKETIATSLRKSKEYTEKIKERSDAVATYLKSVASGKEKSVDKYFGKKNLAHLRGQRIVEVIKGKIKELHEVKN